MASYLNKLRRLSKQPEAPAPKKTEATAEEPATGPTTGAPKTTEPTPATSTVPKESVASPPAPAVTDPEEEVEVEPVLDAEDEKFLERLSAIASEPEVPGPPLPTRPAEVVDAKGEKKVGRDAQEALMDGADQIALPQSPPEVTTGSTAKGKETFKDGLLSRQKSVVSYFSNLSKTKKGDKEKKKDVVTDKDRAKAADDLLAAAEASKAADTTEAQKEEKELTDILDQLNLSAVNNRVFSFSKESEELLNKFTQVLKDVVNGVPTAYNDLEKLFTDYEGQLKKMYGGLPPFLQNLVKSLPAKLTATLGPELLAAQAEKPGFDAKTAGAGPSKGKRSKIPSIPTLKQLVTAQGAVATALRSIVNFLKFRFPALAGGTNLIMSLAVFLLLFVFWYCHKRGRETRLEKERLAAEDATAQGSSASSINEDNDSIFGDKKKAAAATSLPTAEASGTIAPATTQTAATPAEPVREADLPSVSHLPDPEDDTEKTLEPAEPLKQ